MLNPTQAHEVVADAGDSLRETIKKFWAAAQACRDLNLPDVKKELIADAETLENMLTRFEGG